MSSIEIKKYSENELKLFNIFPELLGEELLDVEKIVEGEVNYVYIASLKERKVVVKIFSTPHSPKSGKNPWVDQLLSTHNIERSALLFYSRESTHFPYGVAIFEYVSGRNAKHAIAEGTLSEEDFARAQANLLRKVHTVKLSHYGFDKQEGLLDFMLHPVLKASRDEALAQPDLQRAITIGADTLAHTMQRYSSRLTPVLTHGDCEPKNTIITPASGNVLVDWDNCEGNIWMRDLACLLFGKINDQVAREKVTAFQEAFFEGYGVPEGFSREEILDIVHALHIRKAVQLITYYLARNNLPKHEEMRHFLYRLVA